MASSPYIPPPSPPFPIWIGGPAKSVSSTQADDPDTADDIWQRDKNIQLVHTKFKTGCICTYRFDKGGIESQAVMLELNTETQVCLRKCFTA